MSKMENVQNIIIIPSQDEVPKNVRGPPNSTLATTQAASHTPDGYYGNSNILIKQK